MNADSIETLIVYRLRMCVNAAFVHQLCFINSVPHLGQRTMILPFPLGIRIFWLQCGHL